MAKFCTACGAQLEEATKFCTSCGATLGSMAPPPAPQQQQPIPYPPPQQEPYAAQPFPQQPYPQAQPYPQPMPYPAPMPAAAPPATQKKPLLKRWWVWALAAVTLVIILVIALPGGGNSKQAELISYINEELPKLMDIANQVDDGFAAVAGPNYTNDNTMYAALRDEVIPASKRLVAACEAVVPAEPELKAIHEIYLAAVKLQDEGFATLLTALENQDASMVESANAKRAAAQAGAEEFMEKLQAYAAANNVTLKK